MKIASSYKSIKLLKKYLSISGKILPRKITKLTRKDQRTLKKAIKTARIVGLLPVWLVNFKKIKIKIK